jgi:UDP-3-O-[3-hydroxymyristoyl] glucosamine N-acyltransferase
MKTGQYTTISKTATVDDTCDVDDYVAIRSRARVGRNVVIKCRATIGMDCTVGDDCFIGAHAILLNGKSDKESDPSHIMDRVFVGACACILPGVRICGEVSAGKCSH